MLRGLIQPRLQLTLVFVFGAALYSPLFYSNAIQSDPCSFFFVRRNGMLRKLKLARRGWELRYDQAV